MKIKLTVDTGYVGGEHVDYMYLPENWDDMSEQEKNNYLNQIGEAFLHECCEFHAELVDDDEADW